MNEDTTPHKTATANNVDPEELAHFEQFAHSWWERDGQFRTLHDMNPLRANYIDTHSPVAERRALDIGCGGGILCEALAARGAQVSGIDLSEKLIAVARIHLAESGFSIDYRQTSAEDLAEREAESYDIVTCLEMLEHVPDPAAATRACAQLARPGGSLYFSTINRNPKAWLMAIVGAEHVLRLLPKGTHEYEKFIKPSELASWARQAGLIVEDVIGMRYEPFSRSFSLTQNASVNYILRARKPT